MAYEPKPGSGSLFTNNRRQKDTHPHYNGSLVMPDGTERWLSAWVKKNDDGSFKLLSLSLGDVKQPKGDGGNGHLPEDAGAHTSDLDDEVPF